METFGNILLATVPAGIVLYGAFLLVKTFIEKEQQDIVGKLKIKNEEVTMPLRLQAYERMALYLEHITPNNLISRMNQADLNVAQLHYLLVEAIREEFNHNFTQQIYISDEAWQAVVNTREELIAMLNQVADPLDKEAPSIEFARAIFQHILSVGNDYTSSALKVLKAEARTLMP